MSASTSCHQALRVRVYSGMDPIAKRRMYLTEVVPPGPQAGDQAEKVGTRLLHQRVPVGAARGPGKDLDSAPRERRPTPPPVEVSRPGQLAIPIISTPVHEK